METDLAQRTIPGTGSGGSALLASTRTTDSDALAATRRGWLLLTAGVGATTNLVGAVSDGYILDRTVRLPSGSVDYDVSTDEQYIFEPQAG